MPSPVPGLNLKFVRETIARRLGRSSRKVELQDEDYREAVATAIRTWQAQYPMHDYNVQGVSLQSDGTNPVGKYKVLARNGDPSLVDGVLDCTFFNSGGKYAYYPYPDQSIDQHLIQGQLREQELIFQDQPEFDAFVEPDPNNSNIPTTFLYVHFTSDSFVDRAGRIPNYVAIKFAWHLDLSEANIDDPVVGLPRVRSDWHQWVLDYATAVARETMAEIRGKFRGIPGPGKGELLPNDADSQLERALKDQERLRGELDGRARQLPMLFD